MFSKKNVKDSFFLLNEDSEHNSAEKNQFIIDEKLFELVDSAEKEEEKSNNINIPRTNPKNCSIELVRILAGFFVVLHHMVLYGHNRRRINYNKSKLLELNNIAMTNNSLFISISAFFLCDSRFSMMRIFRFWTITVINLFYANYLMVKYNIAPFTKEDKYNCLFWFYYVDDIWYSTSHLVFIFLMPFISKFSERIGQKSHFVLILFLLYASSISKSNFNDSRFNISHNYNLFLVVSVLMSYYKKYLFKESIFYGFPFLYILYSFQMKVLREEFIINPNRNYIIKAVFNGFFTHSVSAPCQILMTFCIFHILSHITVPDFLYYPLTFIGKTVYGGYIIGNNVKIRKRLYPMIKIAKLVKQDYAFQPVM